MKLEAEIAGISGRNITVNCSVYNSSMDTLVVPVKLIVEGEMENGNDGEDYTIKGITPDSTDIFRYKVKLKTPKLGDKIAFINAGAYNYHTEFCGLEKLKSLIVDKF